MMPAIPGLWKGWRLRPAFSESALGSDLARLRAFYTERGYLDAAVQLAEPVFSGERADVRFEIEAGPRYRVRNLLLPVDSPASSRLDSFPKGELCDCLRQIQARAEKEGRLDISTEIEAVAVPALSTTPSRSSAGDLAHRLDAPGNDRWVDLTLKVERGPSYVLGQLDFTGQYSVRQQTLRSSFPIAAGEPLRTSRLLQGLARLERTGLFQPLDWSDLEIHRDPLGGRADVTVRVHEARRGRWAISGPAGPLSLFGPVYFSLASRLPPNKR
jgi:outer membrane protein insertion porin family